MELKPRLWRRYVDDIFEVVKKSSVEGLTEFLNNLDDSGSIKFTHEMELNGKLPFLVNYCKILLLQHNQHLYLDVSDHASHDNHVINWPASTTLDRESDESTRWIKEAVHIREEGRQSLNRDEGSYTLSHTYD